jgi:hypothetical protein
MASDDPRRDPRVGPPPPEYRPTREYDGGDSSMRNLALAAVAIAVVVMGGVWALSRHHHAGVPVIEADSTPLRIKPANPGGMQVPGADDAVPPDSNGKENDSLAPPPETPAPQALQRDAQAGAKLPAVSAPALPPAPPSQLAPAPESPLPRAAPAPAPRAEPDRPPKPARTGGTQVQLAALESEAAAKAAWQQMTQRMPELFAGRSPDVVRIERDGHVLWRLRTGGFQDLAEATAFCAKLRARGAGCAIASF